MPGRTTSEAFQAFVEPLAAALGCIARCKLTPSPGGRHELEKVHHLLSNGGGAIAVGGPHRLSLRVRMKYEIVKDDALAGGPYRIHTIAYSYTVMDDAGSGVLDYHWHPDAESHEKLPHLHIGTNQLSWDAILTNKHHVGTGRVSLERIVTQLISDHDVPARRADWREQLTLTDGVFALYRSWS